MCASRKSPRRSGSYLAKLLAAEDLHPIGNGILRHVLDADNGAGGISKHLLQEDLDAGSGGSSILQHVLQEDLDPSWQGSKKIWILFGKVAAMTITRK